MADNIGSEKPSIITNPGIAFTSEWQLAGQEQKDALLESERRFRGTFENAAVGIAHVSLDGKWLLMNDRLCDIVGYSRDELLSLTFQDITYPADLEKDLHLASQLVQGIIQTYTLEKRYIRKDGRIVWISLTGSVVRDEKGLPEYFIAVIVDVNERKTAEEKSRLNEQRFKTAFSNAAVGVAITDANGTFLQVNNAYEKLVGYSEEELKSMTFRELNHPADNARNVSEIARLLANEIPHLITEKRYIHKTGREVWVLVSVSIVRGDNGVPENIIAIAQDTTEQKHLKEQIVASEKQFRTLANSIPQLAWIADQQGRRYWFNERWFEYTGCSFEDSRGYGWKDVHHPKFKDEVFRTLETAWQKPEPWEHSFMLRRHDGVYRWFLTRAYPVLDSEGKVHQWIGTNTDIDDQKRFAEQLEVLINQRTAELKASNEDLQQFAHVASHDLKEPVRKIRTFAGRLADDEGTNLSEKGRKYLQKIERAAERMYTMIEGVLSYSTFSDNSEPFEAVDLNDVVNEVVADLELIVQQKQATILFNNLPQVFGAPVLINQLFYNLVNNSLKFSRPDVPPIIRIASASTDVDGRPFVVITIVDNGIGFDPEHAGRIFETFARLHSKDAYDGTGLGLSMCRKIVERHGGAIEATGSKDSGATFTLTLPAVRP